MKKDNKTPQIKHTFEVGAYTHLVFVFLFKSAEGLKLIRNQEKEDEEHE